MPHSDVGIPLVYTIDKLKNYASNEMDRRLEASLGT